MKTLKNIILASALTFIAQACAMEKPSTREFLKQQGKEAHLKELDTKWMSNAMAQCYYHDRMETLYRNDSTPQERFEAEAAYKHTAILMPNAQLYDVEKIESAMFKKLVERGIIGDLTSAKNDFCNDQNAYCENYTKLLNWFNEQVEKTKKCHRSEKSCQ